MLSSTDFTYIVACVSKYFGFYFYLTIFDWHSYSTDFGTFWVLFGYLGIYGFWMLLILFVCNTAFYWLYFNV